MSPATLVAEPLGSMTFKASRNGSSVGTVYLLSENGEPVAADRCNLGAAKDGSPPPVARRPQRALPRPPAHLSSEAKRIWTQVVKQWVVDDSGLPTLRLGLEAFDLSQQCRLKLANDNLTTVTESTGVIRINPLAKLQLDAMAEYRAALRQLGLTPIED